MLPNGQLLNLLPRIIDKKEFNGEAVNNKNLPFLTILCKNSKSQKRK